MTTICQQIGVRIGERFACTEVNGYVRIRTPFLFPDGDIIDLFYQSPQQGVATLSDLGETVGWLRLQTTSARRSDKQTRLITDICQTLGVEFFGGKLNLRVHSEAELSDAVLRLSQAAIRVADLWFTFRARAVESVTDEIADYLDERQVEYERAVSLPGRSGRVWNIDFHTRSPRRSSLVLVLSTGSRAAARRVAEHAVATWYDLSNLRAGREAPDFVSLFDDTSDVWTDQEFRLVEDLSRIQRWSRPDEFAATLLA